MNISQNIELIRKQIPTNITLIAVSKTKPNEDLMQAYNSNQRIFGENKAQELKQKYETLPKDIRWHFIGHLQENKIKYIINYVEMIHSVDSLKLLIQINKHAIKVNRVIDCLLEMDISNEDSKFGLNISQANDLLTSQEFRQMKNVRICGLMGIGSITEDRNQTRKEFRQLKKWFDEIKEQYFQNCDYFKEISMGMTSDYDLAIQEGSTMVRIGSKIFGERNYDKI